MGLGLIFFFVVVVCGFVCLFSKSLILSPDANSAVLIHSTFFSYTHSVRGYKKRSQNLQEMSMAIFFFSVKEIAINYDILNLRESYLRI